MKILRLNTEISLELKKNKRIDIFIKNKEIYSIFMIDKDNKIYLKDHENINVFLNRLQESISSSNSLEFEYKNIAITYSYEEVIYICNNIFNLIKDIK